MNNEKLGGASMKSVVLEFNKEHFFQVFSPVLRAKYSLTDELVDGILLGLWNNFLELGQAKSDWVFDDLNNLEFLDAKSDEAEDENLTIYFDNGKIVVGTYH